MHHALHIQEILLNIFGHCCPPEPHWTAHRYHSTAVLAALARTCRTFKEPALDALWSELVDLTPLPQCVPEACGVSGKVRPPLFLRVDLCKYYLLLSAIHSKGGLMRRSGISFAVTPVVSGIYSAMQIPMGGSTMRPS